MRDHLIFLAAAAAILIGLFFAGSVYGQTPASSPLPGYLIGTGAEWNRYSPQPYSVTTSLALRIGGSNVYSWSTLATPFARTPAGGTPIPSSMRTGAAYVFAQSAGGNVFLFGLGDVGLSATPTANLAAYSGGLGLAVRIRKSNFYLMPLYRAIGAAGTSVQAVPELMLWYSFGGK